MANCTKKLGLGSVEGASSREEVVDDGGFDARRSAGVTRESKQRLRAALETRVDTLAIDNAVRDSAGRVVDVRGELVHRGFCEFGQITGDDQLGRRLLELPSATAPSRISKLYWDVTETGELWADDGLELTVLLGRVAAPGGTASGLGPVGMVWS